MLECIMTTYRNRCAAARKAVVRAKPIAFSSVTGFGSVFQITRYPPRSSSSLILVQKEQHPALCNALLQCNSDLIWFLSSFKIYGGQSCVIR